MIFHELARAIQSERELAIQASGRERSARQGLPGGRQARPSARRATGATPRQGREAAQEACS
jgi:hypothetical protein